jgi:hypothetical protein
MIGMYVGDLLRLPVRSHGIQLARPVDVIFDRERRRALGLEVHCGDEERRFLPLAVATRASHELAIPSSLVLLDGSELHFYTERGATFASLRGLVVERAGVQLGQLADLRLDAEGTIDEVVVDAPEGRTTVPYDDGTRLLPRTMGVRAAS